MELNIERMAIRVDLPHPLRRSRPQGTLVGTIKDTTVVGRKIRKGT